MITFIGALNSFKMVVRRHLKKNRPKIPENEVGYSLSIDIVVYHFHRAPDVHLHRVIMAVDAFPYVD